MSTFPLERWLILLLAAGLLSACGVAQRVGDGAQATASAIFYKQVKTLHLDFTARPALNTDSSDVRALSVPVLLRVYQLRDSQALTQSAYQQLLADDNSVLGAALLTEHQVIVKPGEGAQLSVPLAEQASAVAVVGLFRDARGSDWRLLLSRDELEPERARVIELNDRALSLQAKAREAS
ncbi:type VI secretion system lipoprotein TssJ [Pseudomonas sp. dw_358]|uniref:type VI secretion system lipoprotein TssJ n=1 Tax=Pseudomonas sp. dw_358 TaxID=2720083 RepID=UPI001BD3381B|nr:type VI secretion system lipoprotein TssJ [Pseudomonas sp. dw_358]